jgi:hypothetical protein
MSGTNHVLIQCHILEEWSAQLHCCKSLKTRKFSYSVCCLQPRYIQSLLKQAERRKREQERRLEREVQKEREAEGDEFKDKEEFITSAYRKKLEEFKKLDEEERRQDQIDGWCNCWSCTGSKYACPLLKLLSC